MIMALSAKTAFIKHANLCLRWGIVLILLGAIAISAAMLTTFISVVFLGILLMIGGFVVIVDAFTVWRRHHRKGFFLHLIMGLLYFIVGLMVIKNPVTASVSITLLLGIFYIVLGIFRIISSLSLRMPRWGWGAFSGAVSLLLGILIMASWPVSSLYIIGLFVGIDLLLCGWVYLTGALAARALIKTK
jgi:uncharacterized membrane protein HdeD (DUF308 family)